MAGMIGNEEPIDEYKMQVSFKDKTVKPMMVYMLMKLFG